MSHYQPSKGDRRGLEKTLLSQLKKRDLLKPAIKGLCCIDSGIYCLADAFGVVEMEKRA